MANRRDILFLSLGLASSIVLAISAFLLVPSSIAFYAPVAAQLPSQTRLVFSAYYLCALLPVLVLLVWFFWRTPDMRGPAAATLGVLGSLALGWWAVYQPELILEMVRRGLPG